MKKRNSIFKNYVFNMAFMVLKVLIPLITTPYVSRILLADGVGTVSYAESIASIFVMFSVVGIDIYGRREIAYSGESIQNRSIAFWNIKLIEFCSSLLMLCLYIIYSIKSNSIISLIFAVNIIAVFFDVSWFFQGMEAFGEIAIRNIICKLLNMFYIFAFVKTKDDIGIYAIGMTIFPLLSNISCWIGLSKYIKIVPFNKLNPFKHIKSVFVLFVPTIAIQIYSILDKTMIGLISNSRFENGYYEQSTKLVMVVLSVITALSPVLVARIGYYYKEKQMDNVMHYVYFGYRFILMLVIPICVGLFILSNRIVSVFFGPGYEKSIYLLRILTPLIFSIGISNITSHAYLVPVGDEKIFSKTVVMGSCINLVCNLFLIYFLSSIGAAIASVISETFVMVSQLFYARKEIDIKKIISYCPKYFIASLLMGFLVWAESKVLTGGVMCLGVLIGSGGIIYTVSLLLLNDSFFKDNLSCIVRKIVKK